MEWLNPPPHAIHEEDRIHVVTGAKTDLWRPGNIPMRDSGHFYYQPVEGNFVAEVKVSGAYKDLYDQAGLGLRLDEANWLKCGIEYYQGVQHISTVITHPLSDWSLAPLPGAPASIYLQLRREDTHVQVLWSLVEGAEFHLFREAFWELPASVLVGIMCASPLGGGYPVTFEGLKIRSV